MASGGNSHGRAYGLGNAVKPSSLSTSNIRKRARASHYVSVLTQDGDNTNHTSEEVTTMLEERDRLHAEEIARRDKQVAERENYNTFLIQELYKLNGHALPTYPGGAVGNGGADRNVENNDVYNNFFGGINFSALLNSTNLNM